MCSSSFYVHVSAYNIVGIMWESIRFLVYCENVVPVPFSVPGGRLRLTKPIYCVKSSPHCLYKSRYTSSGWQCRIPLLGGDIDISTVWSGWQFIEAMIDLWMQWNYEFGDKYVDCSTCPQNSWTCPTSLHRSPGTTFLSKTRSTCRCVVFSSHTHFAIIHRHIIHANCYVIWLVSVYE